MISRTFFLFLAMSLMTFTFGCASDGHKIQVQVNGISNAEAYLGYHFGDRQYLKDTVQIDQQGRMVFEGSQRLDPGMYLVVVPGQKYFEIIVDKNQHFSLTTTMDNFVPDMTFENSPDNHAFYEYLRFIAQQGEIVSGLQTQLQDETLGPAQRGQAEQKIAETNQRVKDRQQQYINDFPDGLFSKVLLAQGEPQMPEAPKKEDGTPDQAALYQIYKARFWENIDFSDDRLLRTPVFHGKLMQYFNRVLMQIPDSISKEADRLIEKTRANQEVFKYTVWFITNNFERSQIMGMDAVFVHMVENYYMNGEAFWIEPENLEKITQRAMALKPLLIGQVAPDVTMFRPDGTPLSLHEVKSDYLVLYFWDSECSHCKKVTPELNGLFEQMKDQGLNVFGVNIEGEPELWKNGISKYGLQGWINVNDPFNQSGFRDKYDIYATPLIFLLDKDKKIMAKRITVEQVQDIITRDRQMP